MKYAIDKIVLMIDIFLSHDGWKDSMINIIESTIGTTKPTTGKPVPLYDSTPFMLSPKYALTLYTDHVIDTGLYICSGEENKAINAKMPNRAAKYIRTFTTYRFMLSIIT